MDNRQTSRGGLIENGNRHRVWIPEQASSESHFTRGSGISARGYVSNLRNNDTALLELAPLDKPATLFLRAGSLPPAARAALTVGRAGDAAPQFIRGIVQGWVDGQPDIKMRSLG